MAMPCSSHFPRAHNHKQGLLDILQFAPTKAAVATALAKWSMEAFETVAFQKHLSAAALRSFKAMDTTPHEIYQMDINPVSITRSGRRTGMCSVAIQPAASSMPPRGSACSMLESAQSDARACEARLRPHARSAWRGSPARDVAAPALAALPRHGHLVRQAHDPTQPQRPRGCSILRTLVHDADVIPQAYRPHGRAARGFGPEDCTALRPGIVLASFMGFSPGGPWQDVKSTPGIGGRLMVHTCLARRDAHPAIREPGPAHSRLARAILSCCGACHPTRKLRCKWDSGNFDFGSLGAAGVG